MHQDIKEVLYSEKTIENRITQLAAEISEDYSGEELLIVPILKGSFLFAAELCKKIKIPLQIDFMGISSYGDETKSTGVVKILKDLEKPIRNKNVLIVEDIIDTGLTINYLLKLLSERKPNSLRVCTLLNKPSTRKINVQIDYIGFIVPNEFVVGFGLDYRQYYRNLPYIGILKEQIYEQH